MVVNVLLVDDEVEFSEILAERLRARNLTVDLASDGKTALAKVKSTAYDVIFLDLEMPELDGIETLKMLLKENEDLQIIFITGHASLQKGIEAVKLGAKEFFEKPVDIEQIVNTVKKAQDQTSKLAEKKVEKQMKNFLGKKGWD